MGGRQMANGSFARKTVIHLLFLSRVNLLRVVSRDELGLKYDKILDLMRVLCFR